MKPTKDDNHEQRLTKDSGISGLGSLSSFAAVCRRFQHRTSTIGRSRSRRGCGAVDGGVLVAALGHAPPSTAHVRRTGRNARRCGRRPQPGGASATRANRGHCVARTPLGIRRDGFPGSRRSRKRGTAGSLIGRNRTARGQHEPSPLERHRLRRPSQPPHDCIREDAPQTNGHGLLTTHRGTVRLGFGDHSRALAEMAARAGAPPQTLRAHHDHARGDRQVPARREPKQVVPGAQSQAGG